MKKHILFVTALCAFSLALAGCMDLFDKGSYTPKSDWTTWDDGICMCISADGSNADGNGRPEAPFKDIRYAITQIDEKGDPEESYTVYIIGTVSQTINITDLPCKRIRIAGYPDSGEENVWTPEDGGRCLEVSTTLPVEVRDLTFTGTTSGEKSPVLVSEGKQLAIVDCVFKNNTLNSAGSFRGGGAIFNNGTVYIYGNTTFSNNTVIGSGSSGGGAIFNRTTGTVKIGSEVTVDGAPATGTVKFIQNEANAGGAIYNDGGIVAIGGAQFTSNTTSSSGGAIHLNGGTASINHGTIISANESADGGGVYIAGGAIVTMSDTTITSNEASSFGAGICNDSGTLTLNAGTIISENNALEGAGVYNDSTFEMKDGVQIFANTASNNGGGVHNGSYGSFILSGGEIGKTGSANTAAFGGGVYNEGTFTMNDGTIGDSSATTTATESSDGGHANKAADGAGVYNDDGLCKISGGMISYNYATQSGAGLYSIVTSDYPVDNGSAPKIQISGGSINYNAVPNAGSSDDVIGNGGGVYLRGDNCTSAIAGGTIKGNKARNGGGVCVAGNMYDDEDNLSEQGRHTLNFSAGVIGCGIVDTSDATLIPNSAKDGGGLWIGEDALCNMSGGQICGNESYPEGSTGNTGGGAVYMYGKMIMTETAVVGDSSVSEVATATKYANKSNKAAGGIFIDGGSLILDDSLTGGVYYNYAATGGAGIYACGYDSDVIPTKLYMAGGYIAYNYSEANGAGIWNQSGTTVCIGGNIKRNKLGNGDGVHIPTGAGIYNYGTLWILGNALIGEKTEDPVSATDYSNWALTGGGAISNSNSNAVYIETFSEGAGIYHNYAMICGGLYNELGGSYYSNAYTISTISSVVSDNFGENTQNITDFGTHEKTVPERPFN